MTEMTLQDRVALVTGGASGIGKAICRAFAAEGATVAVLDRNGDAARELVEQLGRGVTLPADVGDSAAVDRATQRVVDELGSLDILVNNAGIIGVEEARRAGSIMEQQVAEAGAGKVSTPLRSVANLTDDQWRKMLATHLDGTFYCTRAAMRAMAPKGRGVVINIASICGIEGCAGLPHYSAAKAGILGLTRAVAKDAILQGIRVNAIAPGFTDTPLLDVLTPLLRGSLAVQTPVGRMGTVDEIAAVAVFLASDRAGFFVGETLSPNGGYLTV